MKYVPHDPTDCGKTQFLSVNYQGDKVWFSRCHKLKIQFGTPDFPRCRCNGHHRTEGPALILYGKTWLDLGDREHYIRGVRQVTFGR